jgi:hypothetical protein
MPPETAVEFRAGESMVSEDGNARHQPVTSSETTAIVR